MSQIELNLPDIGEGVTEGEMVKWLVSEGDQVEADQPVAEIMTDKATVEVPVARPGKITSFKVNVGDMIPVGGTMLLMEAGSASAQKTKEEPAKATKPEATTQKQAAPSTQTQSKEISPPVAEVTVLATPATRRLAREMNVDINQITGTGLAGRVSREDVMNYQKSSESGSAAPARTLSIPSMNYQTFNGDLEERVPLRGIRKKIAANMQMAKQVIPHFTLMDEANVTELVKTRKQAKEAGAAYGVKVTYLPYIMKALIATVREYPMFNASIDDEAGEIVNKNYFNIGFAADTPTGLMVPVVHNADQKNILQLSQEITTLAGKARDGKLALNEMKGATITITNIGSIGGSYATPIINHPEVAILGMYKIVTKPVWNGSEFVPTPMMNFTVTADHRLIDGAVAANFLKAFFKKIENPSELFLHMV